MLSCCLKLLNRLFLVYITLSANVTLYGQIPDLSKVITDENDSHAWVYINGDSKNMVSKLSTIKKNKSICLDIHLNDFKNLLDSLKSISNNVDTLTAFESLDSTDIESDSLYFPNLKVCLYSAKFSKNKLPKFIFKLKHLNFFSMTDYKIYNRRSRQNFIDLVNKLASMESLDILALECDDNFFKNVYKNPNHFVSNVTELWLPIDLNYKKNVEYLKTTFPKLKRLTLYIDTPIKEKNFKYLDGLKYIEKITIYDFDRLYKNETKETLLKNYPNIIFEGY
jgi:hypothetical protein